MNDDLLRVVRIGVDTVAFRLEILKLGGAESDLLADTFQFRLHLVDLLLKVVVLVAARSLRRRLPILILVCCSRRLLQLVELLSQLLLIGRQLLNTTFTQQSLHPNLALVDERLTVSSGLREFSFQSQGVLDLFLGRVHEPSFLYGVRRCSSLTCTQKLSLKPMLR